MQTFGPENIYRTDRDLESYRRFYGQDLGFDEEVIVDLGAGDSPMAQQIGEHHPLARIVRVDFDYSEIPPVDRLNAIAATAGELPLSDNSVDKIISSCMFCYLTKSEATQVAAESLRALRPGGRLVFDARRQKNKDIFPPEVELWRVRGRMPLSRYTMLGVTKPPEYDDWPESRREALSLAIGQAVSASNFMMKLIQTHVWMRIVRRSRENLRSRIE